MSYCIGLDCGTTSVGWAVLALNSEDEPYRIINLGSRIFTAAENPKNGSSLAAPRRENRSRRRLLRRHRHRNERIRQLIIKDGIIDEKTLSHLFEGQLTDIYQLRAEALDRILTDEEFARVLIHIAQRRGFKSNRKSSTEGDDGKLLAAVSENASLMKAGGYRTVGEMFFKDDKFKECKRNKGGEYNNTISRNLIEDEIHSIFSAQRKAGNLKATEELEAKYAEIVLSQRSFEEGPGGNSKYGGNQIEKMIGKCTFFPEEKRAVKASYSFQLFTLWQKINNIKIITGGEIRSLDNDERYLIFNLAHKKAGLTFNDLRKTLGMSDDSIFNYIDYYNKTIDVAEKVKFDYLKEYHEIRKALNKVSKNRIQDYSRETLNDIGYILTVYKNDEIIIEKLKELNLEESDILALLNVGSFKKVGHVSVKACDMILPFLEKGMKYNEACEAAGFDFKSHGGEKSFTLPGYAPELADLKNPVVKRAVSQTIKVINAIIREQGESPVYINIELAREMSKDFFERLESKKQNEENRARNERALETIRNEFKIYNPSGMDLVKYKLWQEQDGVCAYSQKNIKLEDLFKDGYAEVDHIFPYSISFDDSYKNKVLVLTEENRNKGNRLPLQYLTGERRDKYIVWVNSSVKNYKKRRLLLKEKLSKDETEGLKQRSLQDTQYLSRFLYNYITDHLEFAPSASGKIKRVTSVNGAITAYMRKRWGIAKIREDGDLHHAADAVVIACVTNKMIKKISDYSKYRELRYTEPDLMNTSLVIDSETGEVIDRFPFPWEGFRNELDIRLLNDPQRVLKNAVLPNYTSDEQEAVRPAFVSRMPARKTRGAAHDATIRSPKLSSEGLVISKTPLSKLKLKDGEIDGYYNPDSDRLLYEALKAKLIAAGGNAAAAFTETFYKPTSSGKQGPAVKSVKICQKSSLNVEVNKGKGVANNGEMVRIDIYKIDGKGYYFVPIYISDTVKPELPNKAVTRGKPYEEWLEMKDDDFLFSLYPNDVILVRSKKPIETSLKFKSSSLEKNHLIKDELLYYMAANISTASITAQTHDGAYIISGMGIKSLLSIEKYETDVLGNCRKIEKENRKGFGD